MISVCIPVYNFNVTNLVKELHRQLTESKEEFEILLIDDASDNSFRDTNKKVEDLCSYKQLSENVGRATIRNKFIAFAKYDFLLFLDCDSVITKTRFIENYINIIKKPKTEVVCGGRIYGNKPSNIKKLLRWKYGKFIESRTVEQRLKFPYRSFMTNNFVIKKSVLNNIKFNEQITSYGHEDTIFGIELKNKGVNIKHIDNPVYNGDTETAEVYLKKTEEGVRNLVHIWKLYQGDEIIDDIRLIKTYRKIKRISNSVIFLYFLLKRPSYFLFKRGIISLKLFSFVKLGLFTKLMKKEKGLN